MKISEVLGCPLDLMIVRKLQIPGNPEAVLCLGPSAIRDRAGWTIGTANSLANFMQVVELIYRSKWRTSPLQFPMRFGDKEVGDAVRAVFPAMESTASVLPYFRQLYSEPDALFKKSCDNFKESCFPTAGGA